MSEIKEIDSYKFLDLLVKRLVRNWIKMEQPRPIPWTPLTKPLAESTIAMVTSAGIALKEDKPFDQEGERQNPWWGDPSFRVLPQDTRSEGVNLYHMHISSSLVEQDMNTLFPLPLLLELEAQGEIGQAAANHYSYMGYILNPEVLLCESIPGMVARMKADGVDAAVMVPG